MILAGRTALHLTDANKSVFDALVKKKLLDENLHKTNLGCLVSAGLNALTTAQYRCLLELSEEWRPHFLADAFNIPIDVLTE